MPASTFRRVAPLATLTFVTVGLGIWGLSRMPERDQGATNTLYETLQLFYVNREPADGVPWQLDVARFLAPLVVLYALVVTLLALAHHELRRVFTRLFARGHVLVVGAGTRGTMVARSLRGSHTVVVERIREAVEDEDSITIDSTEMATGDDVLVVLDALRPARRTAWAIAGLQISRDRDQIGIEPPCEIALDDESRLAGVGRVDEDGSRDTEPLQLHHATSVWLRVRSGCPEGNSKGRRPNRVSTAHVTRCQMFQRRSRTPTSRSARSTAAASSSAFCAQSTHSGVGQFHAAEHATHIDVS